MTDKTWFYYATVVSGGRTGYLAGPFATHQEALDVLDQVADLALEADPWSVFYAFGTVRRSDARPTGVFNKALKTGPSPQK